MIISSCQLLWMVYDSLSVACVEAKGAMCITHCQLEIKIAGRQSPVTSRSLGQSHCVYHGPERPQEESLSASYAPHLASTSCQSAVDDR